MDRALQEFIRRFEMDPSNEGAFAGVVQCLVRFVGDSIGEYDSELLGMIGRRRTRALALLEGAESEAEELELGELVVYDFMWLARQLNSDRYELDCRRRVLRLLLPEVLPHLRRARQLNEEHIPRLRRP